MKEGHKYENRLIKASSPYLLQHAHNPVDWFEWGEEAWNKAKAEDKLVLVSIGYAACHWCHVMEHESFENEDTAAIMNEYFVCIKVDREERPDVDQVYMDAVQLITGHGGWPLNMFCLPDGRPLHGGTYFPNREWNQLLFQLHDLKINKRKEAEEYADKLFNGVRSMDLIKDTNPVPIGHSELQELVDTWKKQFDFQHGGMSRSPKFPLPNNYRFLLNYALLAEDKDLSDFVHFTLKKIALGGIYDQIEGGFARYSVDTLWLVPHFEKMLYDNAQLISLYSKAFISSGEVLYKKIVEQTIDFVLTNWKNGEGAYYASFDADSEGEEGKYYVWELDEIKSILGPQAALVAEYYKCTQEGNWEDGKNILHAQFTPQEFASLHNINEEEFDALLTQANQTLLKERQKRIAPALDDKVILSWNALMLEALCDAYQAFNKPEYLHQAQELAHFCESAFKQDGQYYRIYKNGVRSIPAFLEDLSALQSAYLSLYQVSGDEAYALAAKDIANDILNRFVDEETPFFYFTPKEQNDLAVRKKDLGDDVISSGNSMLCLNFKKLHALFAESTYKEISDKMLEHLSSQFKKYPSWYSHWGQSYLNSAFGLWQICYTGSMDESELAKLRKLGNHHTLLVPANPDSQLPITENRIHQKKTFYVCFNEMCYAPVKSLKEVEELLQQKA